MSDAIFDETLTPPSSAQSDESTSTKVEAIYVATIGFSSRRSCHEVTDEVKSHGMMLFSARHCVGRYALMPPIL